jgi:hypothetical protein
VESYTNTVLRSLDASFDVRTNEVYLLEAITGCDQELTLEIGPLRTPANDAVAGRSVIPATPAAAVGSMLGATADTDVQGLSKSRWIWWSWVPPGTGVYRLTTEGSQFAPLITVLDGPSLPAAVSRLYTTGGATSSGSARFVTDAGREVVIGFTQQSPGSGPGLKFAITPVIQPINDRFDAPEPLSGGTLELRGVLRQPTIEPGEPGVSSRFSGGSLWYTWTPPVADTYYLAASPVLGAGPVITLYSGDELGELVPKATASPTKGTYEFAELAGPLRIQIAGLGTDAGVPFRFLVLPRTPEANDSFDGALPLPGVAGTNAIRTLWATIEPGEPVPAAAPFTNTLWFRFTAAAAGKAVFGSTDFPLACSVYEGSGLGALSRTPGSLETVNGLLRQTYPVLAGHAYTLQVSSAPGLPRVTMTWSLPPPPGGQPPSSTALAASLLSLGGHLELRIRLQLPAGSPTVIEGSPDLSQWTPVLTNINLGIPLEFLTPISIDAPQEFFRVSPQP